MVMGTDGCNVWSSFMPKYVLIDLAMYLVSSRLFCLHSLSMIVLGGAPLHLLKIKSYHNSLKGAKSNDNEVMNF